MDLETIKGILNNWAASKILINRVWVFGSRAKGTHKPDSDLDIAIELDINHLSHGDSSGGWGTFMHESKTWKKN